MTKYERLEMGEILKSKYLKEDFALGGKSNGLIFLKKSGFNVPEFFIIDFNTLENVRNGEYRLEGLIDEWRARYKIQDDCLWAARSSSGSEDGREGSFAGLFHTEINVGTTALKDAVLKVLDSYLNIENLDYPTSKTDARFSVIIQKMIRPEYSGVVFSKNPYDPTDDSMVINIIPGLGEGLVSGKEEAMTILVNRGKKHFENVDKTYRGTNFNEKEGTVTVLKKGAEIRKDVQRNLKSLVKGVNKLEKLRKYPVDVEFCISGNKIYWLQARPVTTVTNADVLIWDNTGIGENFPGVTLPLSSSFVQFTYFTAYSGLFRFLGLGKHKTNKLERQLKNMVGIVHGAMYYNVTAWQQLLGLLPFGKKTGRLYTKIMGMDYAGFVTPDENPGISGYWVLLKNVFRSFIFFKKIKKAYEKNYTEFLDKYNYRSYHNISYEKGVEQYHRMTEKLSLDWVAPVLNGFFAMMLLTTLRRILNKTKLIAEHPNFINDILFSQGEVISVSIVRNFQNILSEVQQNKDLYNLFKEKRPKDVLAALTNNFIEFNTKLLGYIEKFGERTEDGELKMETTNYIESPEKFVAFIAGNLVGDVRPGQQTGYFDFKRVLNRYYRFRPIKKAMLKFFIENTIKRVKDRENYRFVRTKIYAHYKILFRQMDLDLFQNGYIAEKGASLYLTLHEILDKKKLNSFNDIILRRKSEYGPYMNMEHFHRYYQVNDQFTAVMPKTTGDGKGNIKGVGCCSGIVKARVKIINEGNLLNHDYSGFILVAKNFEPGWINLFSAAKGIISEKGNLLSHTSILCRELGVPSIVGARGVLGKIQEGDFIEMNGATGEIKMKGTT